MELSQVLSLKYLYSLKMIGIDYLDMSELETTLENHQNLPFDIDKLKDIVNSCTLCDLSTTRKNVVFGEENLSAKVMFIGEGPGAMEDSSGKPFVGRAGQLLTKMIENVLDIKREDVYIANIVKCRPPNNRVPTPMEATTCKSYLLRQIEIIKPKIIVALGATSYHHLTEDKARISTVRGRVFEFGDFYLIPTYHPSFLLRNPSAKKDAYQDLLKIKSLL